MAEPEAKEVTVGRRGSTPAMPDPDEPIQMTDSPMLDLMARRKEIVEQLYLDLPVPRWDSDGGPAIFVRLTPASPTQFGMAMEKRRKQNPRPKDWVARANADVLVQCCVGVYAVISDGSQVSLKQGDPFGGWTKFDHDLAVALGMPIVEDLVAVEVVLKLFFTEADMLACANKLAQWSGAKLPEADSDFFAP